MDFCPIFILCVVLCIPYTNASEKTVSDSTMDNDTPLMKALNDVFGKENSNEGLQKVLSQMANEMQNMGNVMRRQESEIEDLKQQESEIEDLKQDVNMLNEKVIELENTIKKVSKQSVNDVM